MGKNRDRESLIRVLAGTIIHEILFKKTNKPESKNHLQAEIIGYRSVSDEMVKERHWNSEDKEYIGEKVLRRVIIKMERKYDDVEVQGVDVEKQVSERINELLSEG